jgi:prevent-host-death family protein
MTTISLSQAKDSLSACVKRAGREEIIITRHGKPVAVLRGFRDEDDYLEYRLLNDPRFRKMIEQSRREAREGNTIPLEDLE